MNRSFLQISSGQWENLYDVMILLIVSLSDKTYKYVLYCGDVALDSEQFQPIGMIDNAKFLLNPKKSALCLQRYSSISLLHFASIMSTLNASCLCGCIKITLTGIPIKCMTCHCIDCQKNAGGPYQTNAMFPTSAVNVSDPHGYAKVYTVPGSQVGSGFEKRKWFCGNCGCTLFTRPMKFKGQKTVFKTGLLDASSPEGGSG